MFICSMCKNTCAGDPSRINAAGSFCELCHTEITRRVKESVQSRYVPRTKLAAVPGICNWCGCEIKDGNRRDQHKNMCKICYLNQGWLLKCIRHSEWPARYTERVNRREVKRRNEMAQQAQVKETKQQEQKQLFIQPTQTSSEKLEVKPNQELETRMDAIESLLKNLNKALGIVPQ